MGFVHVGLDYRGTARGAVVHDLDPDRAGEAEHHHGNGPAGLAGLAVQDGVGDKLRAQ
jgi:hypothetical protein